MVHGKQGQFLEGGKMPTVSEMIKGLLFEKKESKKKRQKLRGR